MLPPKKAFILKDYLLSLFIILLFYPLLLTSLQKAVNFRFADRDIADMIQLNQLRERLILAEDFKLKADEVTFKINEEEWHLHYDGKRLYLYPGYLLYLDDVKNLSFILNDDRLGVSFYRQGARRYYALH